MPREKGLTPAVIIVLLWHLSENDSEGGELSDNDDESKDITYESNTLTDSDIN